jgi:hypothetical protein
VDATKQERLLELAAQVAAAMELTIQPQVVMEQQIVAAVQVVLVQVAQAVTAVQVL